jgi:hypothetical protein
MNPTETPTTADQVASVTYRYFVSFTYAAPNGSGFANMTVESNRPINDIAQIHQEQERLRRDGYRNALILSFSLLARVKQANP